MRNPHGSFIWYELLTSDPDGAADFYSDVIGWSAASAGQPGIDYRIFSVADEGVAGHMKMPDGAETMGMRPMWLGYVGVDNVDAALESIVRAGGAVRMPAMDIDGVGRIALVTDPQGIAFYVMRGAVDRPSTSFGDTPGHCSWNELSTPDQEAAIAFYTGQFGWERGDAMPMGDMGTYQFINHDGRMIGAVMRKPPRQERPSWAFYFRVSDIDEAAAKVRARGGSVHEGPHEVPGGDFVIVGSDPQGAAFGLVGKRI